MEKERGSGLSLLEGNAWNITTYELVPDLQEDPFVVGYHVPQRVGWQRGWDRGKRWGVPDICNTEGETEHYNQELKTYLHIFCEGQSQKWLELLPMAKFIHNAAVHSVTSKSLFSLIMEYKPQSYPLLGKTFLPALEQQLNQIEDTQKEAEATHKLA